MCSWMLWNAIFGKKIFFTHDGRTNYKRIFFFWRVCLPPIEGTVQYETRDERHHTVRLVSFILALRAWRTVFHVVKDFSMHAVSATFWALIVSIYRWQWWQWLHTTYNDYTTFMPSFSGWDFLDFAPLLCLVFWLLLKMSYRTKTCKLCRAF